jgi:hypothetical protein
MNTLNTPTIISITQHERTISIEAPRSDLTVYEMADMIAKVVHSAGYATGQLEKYLISALSDYAEHTPQQTTTRAKNQAEAEYQP